LQALAKSVGQSFRAAGSARRKRSHDSRRDREYDHRHRKNNPEA
jgi:hypothetical protein